MTHKTEIIGAELYLLCDSYLSRLVKNGDPRWFFFFLVQELPLSEPELKMQSETDACQALALYLSAL